MKTNLHSHFNVSKFTMIKLCLFTFLFQVTNANAQNPILFDHTWYFEIGNIDNETLVTPEVPENFPENSLFQSTIYLFIENGNNYFGIYHNYCSVFPVIYAEFSNNDNSFIGTDDTALQGFGCVYGEAGYFSDKINYFFGIYFDEMPNPFSYTIEEVENYYKLTITNNDGNWLIYNSILLSNPTFNENTVSLYPNPVQNILNIQNTASNLSKVQIYDLNGRLLQNHALQTNEVSLNVSQLNSGIYLVVLENEMGNRVSRKIVKTTK